MTAWVALLRGINLGSHNKLAMPALRESLSSAGFADVRTILQSGNALFAEAGDEATISERVERVLFDDFKLSVPCVVRDRAGIADAVRNRPLATLNLDGKRLTATFLSKPPPKQSDWSPESLDPDNIRVVDRVVYQWCPDGVHMAPNMLPKLKRFGS